MKKLLIFCAVVASSAMLDSRVDATIVILTDDTKTLDAPTVMDVNFPAEYDLIGDIVTSFRSEDSFGRNEITDTLHTLHNGNIALSTFNGTESSELIFEDSGQIAYNPLTDVAALLFYEYLFDKKQIIDLVYVPDNNNNIIQSSAPRAIPTSPTFKDSSPAEYDPITNTAKLFFDGYLFAENRILDAVYGRINDIIMLTTPGAVLGGLRLGHSGLSKYLPTTNIETLFFDEYLSVKSELLDTVYITDNNNIILSTAPGRMLGSLAFTDSAVPEQRPTTNTAALFFNKDLFARNELPDAVYIPDNNNTILSNALGPILGSLTFENNNLIEYNPITNVAALRFQKSIFANNVNALDIRTDDFVVPEPATIAMLSLGTLFLLRKRKGKKYCNKWQISRF